MEKYINEAEKECYRGVTTETPFSVNLFHKPEWQGGSDGDENFALHTNLGSLTVLDRMTGFGYRDIETGFRDNDNNFWLASGDMDVRQSECSTIGEAIEWVKKRANNCVPAPNKRNGDRR